MQGHSVGCVAIATDRFSSYSARICRVEYGYSGQTFTAVIPYGETTTFFVGPSDTSYRMNEVNFEKGPQATTGNLVFAAVSGFGALSVTSVHLEHRRQRRKSRRASHAAARE